MVLTEVWSFGYDSGGQCDPRVARRGRAQLIASIPCDLSQQSYCNLPGSAYPWHAVRRFVHENQGLMKRMYGDVRQISVLKTEFSENFIDKDDIEEAQERYSKKRHRSMPMKDSVVSKKNRKSDTIMEPHFRLQNAHPNKGSSTTISPTTLTTPSESPPSTISNSQSTPNQVTEPSKPDLSVSTAKDYYLLAGNDTRPDIEIETNRLDDTNGTSKSNEEPITVITLPSKNPTLNSTDDENVERITEEYKIESTNKDISHEAFDESYESQEESDEEKETVTVKGQLFQDTVEKQNVPHVNSRGV